MLHIPVATIVITFGSRLLSFTSSDAKLVLAPVAVAVLGLASVLSLRHFETPLRRYLTDAFDRRFAQRVAVPAIARQETAR